LPTRDDAPNYYEEFSMILKGMGVGFDAGIPPPFLDAVYLKR
jgi:hypothetical protein